MGCPLAVGIPGKSDIPCQSGQGRTKGHNMGRTHTIGVISAIRPDLTIREIGVLASILGDLDTYSLIATIQPSWTVKRVSLETRELKSKGL